MISIEQRPRLSLTRTSWEWMLDGVALVGTVLCLAIPVVAWSSLPERVPVHFDFRGRPDRWGPRGVLFLLPSLLIVSNVGLTLLARIPHHFNYLWAITSHNAERQYRIARSLLAVLKVEVTVLFLYIEWATVRAARGESSGLSSLLIPVLIVALFASVFAHLVAAKRAS